MASKSLPHPNNSKEGGASFIFLGRCDMSQPQQQQQQQQQKKKKKHNHNPFWQ